MRGPNCSRATRSQALGSVTSNSTNPLKAAAEHKRVKMAHCMRENLELKILRSAWITKHEVAQEAADQ